MTKLTEVQCNFIALVGRSPRSERAFGHRWAKVPPNLERVARREAEGIPELVEIMEQAEGPLLIRLTDRGETVWKYL